MLLAGMSGTRKSYIALALALLACTANRCVLYRTSVDMLARPKMSLADDRRRGDARSGQLARR